MPGACSNAARPKVSSVQPGERQAAAAAMGHMTQAAHAYAPHRNGAGADAAGAAHRRALEDLRGHARADRRVARHRARRDPCARGPERLRQVDADQDARRLSHARSRQPCRARRRAVRPRAARSPTGCASSTRTSASSSSSTRWTTSRCTAASRAGAMGRVRWREQEERDPPRPRPLRRRPRHPPPAGRRNAGRAHRGGDRRGAAGLAGRPRRARARRADRGAAARRGRAAVRDGARGPRARARACSTSRTVSTRSSSWPTA